MKILKIAFLILLILIIGTVIAWFGFLRPDPPAISEEDREQIRLIPLPATLQLESEKLYVDAGLSVSFKDQSSDRLEKAVARFNQLIENLPGTSLSGKSEARLVIDCEAILEEFPRLGDDESYSLSVSGEGIDLAAASEMGVLHGLQTVLQLIEISDNKVFLPYLEVQDVPRYPWRGLMIDVSRHWIPKEVILRNLDAMATVKMNVFHWHLTDYQGFRVESKVFPRLHQMGSQGNYYTQEEIREILQYAADRGIRVVPEFDLPGHATSWFVGYPELASAPGPYELDTRFGISEPVMDPTREETYTFLEQFFEEMGQLFPDEYLHIGGDEVNPKHWQSSDDIQQFMRENNLKDHHELQAYFNARLQKIIQKVGKKMIGWDEIIHPELPKEQVLVQSWRSQKSLWQAVKSGHQGILSSGYYLDHKQSSGFHYKVDPLVITGAVTIDIDSTRWNSWACTMTAGDTQLEGTLYLFGEGDQERGIMSFMGNNAGFEEVNRQGESMAFEHGSSFGTLKYEVDFSGDSVKGTASLGIFNIAIDGRRSGANDMDGGEPLPKFEKIEPLTLEEEKSILGGEACMWTEMADQRTLESRIWPRAAAVAEKLWSSRELTTDESDLYRRIIHLDTFLVHVDLQHRAGMRTLIRDLVSKEYVKPLTTLVEVLQEDKLFNRMVIYDPELYTTTPLNRVVDAARPESYIAYQFNREVDRWLESRDPELEGSIRDYLNRWEVNHARLMPALDEEVRLQEVEPHSRYLSLLAGAALRVMAEDEVEDDIQEIIKASSQSYGGTLLSVHNGLVRIIEDTPDQ